ncbi:MAG: FKBP-type peptidyl-prolyl cis-trans isomerase [Candidatus Binatia bacterium]
MAQAKEGDTVRVHYTGRLADGTVFDSSEDREPMEFQIGAGQVIDGFEQAVVGMNPGQSVTTEIVSDEAYGPYRDDMVVHVERTKFSADLDPKVGDQLQVRHGEERGLVVTVTSVGDATVALDANHPLAGKDLTFDIELVEIL